MLAHAATNRLDCSARAKFAVMPAHADAPACFEFIEVLCRCNVLAGHFYRLLGQAGHSRPVAPELEPGEMRMCYRNAGRLAISDSRYAYCEGYALRKGLVPVHHAWLLDQDGCVLDPTWPHDDANEYFGVALSQRMLLEQTARSGVWGLLTDRLSDVVLRQPPDSYLHARWRVEQSAMDQFWDRVCRETSAAGP